MTSLDFIGHFQQDLNNPESILTAIETICVIKKEHNTEINIPIDMAWIHKTVTLKWNCT